MAITTQAGLLAAMESAQEVTYLKTATRTTVAAIWCSLFDIAGNPAAGTLAGASTAAGVVPDQTTPGCPAINSFNGNTGYISNVEHGCSVMCRWRICDMLFKAGAYGFNAAVTLSGQPSYSARIDGGDYKGLEIWIETVTAFTGTPSFAITYTNQDGVAAQTTGTISAGSALKLGSMFQMPLAAGDTGVQKIESVTATVASAGTFNVLVLSRLISGRVFANNDGGSKGPDLVGLPLVAQNAALYFMIAADSTSSGVPELQVSIVNG